MSFDTLHDPVPWAVAEMVCYKVVRLAPHSVFVVGDPDGRVGATIENLLSDPEVEWHCNYFDALVDELVPGFHCGIWLGDGKLSYQESWSEICELGQNSIESILCAEPIVRGYGVGLSNLRSLDPDLMRISTDEIPDGCGGTRVRETWEEKCQWAVAEIAAWRFQLDAESRRNEFVRKLPELDVHEIGRECESILQQWPHAHEVLTMGMIAAAEQGLYQEATALFNRFREQENISKGWLARTQRTLRAHGVDLWREISESEAQRIRQGKQANSTGNHKLRAS